MLFIISLVSTMLIVSGAIWLRNKWIIDTYKSYGVYNSMAGIYLYRKFRLWHIGMYQEDSFKEAESKGEIESILTGELDLTPDYTKQAKTYS